MPPPQFFHHPFIGSVTSNPCHCVTPTEMAKDLLLLGLGDDNNNDPIIHDADNNHDDDAAFHTDANSNQHHHSQLPFMPQSQQQRKRKERSDSLLLTPSSSNILASSSSRPQPPPHYTPSPSQAAKFQKTIGENERHLFESVLDRPFIYSTQLDQVLLEALALFDPAWKNVHARKRLIIHLIHFLELKVGLDAHISNNILMPTRVIEQAWRALVLETSLYQQITYYIQDFHCKPRKILSYSSLRRQQLPPHELRDLLMRTQSFFMCYFQECMPESIKDELPIQEVVVQQQQDGHYPKPRPGFFLLPRFAKKKTTSYAMIDLQQPVLADAIIEEEEDSDVSDEDDDEDEDLLGLDILTCIEKQHNKVMQEEDHNEDAEGMMNIDTYGPSTTVPCTTTRSTPSEEEEEKLLLPMLEEEDNEHKKNDTENDLQEQQEATSTTMDTTFYPVVPMTPVPSSTSTPAVLYSSTSLNMLEQRQEQEHHREHKKNSDVDEHDDGTTASSTMDTTTTATTTTTSVVAPTITAPAIYNSAAATSLLVECQNKISKLKKNINSSFGGDIPRVVYTPGSGKPPAIYSGKSLQRLQQQHEEKIMTTSMYAGTSLY